MPEWLQDASILEAETAHSLPHTSNDRKNLEFTAPQIERLQRALEMSATISDPELRPPPDHLSRPTFCRFLIDSGLVDCDSPDNPECVLYHEAVRCFDATARTTAVVDNIHTHSLLCSIPSVSFSHISEVVNHALARTFDPPSAAERFFEEGLPRFLKLGHALLDERAQRMKQRMIELSDDSHNASLVSSKHRKECMSIHGAPPRTFGGSVQDWASGLHFWMATGDENSTPKAIERQYNQEEALDNYLLDMITEPGVLYVAQVCRGMFENLFDCYADEVRRKWDSEGESTMVKHLSYASFFRFCVDFGIFPALCSFGCAKRAYREVECIEELGKRPAPVREEKSEDLTSEHASQPSLSTSASASVRAGQKGRESNARRRSNAQDLPADAPRLQERRNSFNSVSDKSSDIGVQTLRKVNSTLMAVRSAVGLSQKVTDTANAGSKNKDNTKTGNRRESSSSKSEVKRDRANSRGHIQSQEVPLIVAIDLSWIKLSFSSMSDVRIKLYTFLRVIGDCAADNFNTVVGLCSSVMPDLEHEDSDQEESRSNLDAEKPLAACDRTVDAEAIVDILGKLRVTHPWSVADIEKFVYALMHDGQAKVRLLDLEKAVTRVRDDVQKRSSTESQAFTTRCNEPLSLSSDRASGYIAAFSPLGNFALGDQARQLENEAGWIVKDEISRRFAFGPEGFMECLFRIIFNYLHSTGVPAHAAMPGGAKAVWLITFLHHRFDHMLGAHQIALAGQKSARSSEASTRCWTPESSADSRLLLPRPLARPPSATSLLLRPGSSGASPSARPLSGTSCTSLPPPRAKWAERPKSGGEAWAERPKSGGDRCRDCSATWEPGESARLPKPEAYYTSKHARILEEHPNLFEGLPWLPGRGTSRQSPYGVHLGQGTPLASASCSECGRSKTSEGIGSIHCHACSGVDTSRLRDNPLWPVINHRKLRKHMLTKEDVEVAGSVDGEAIAPKSSAAPSRRNSMADSDWGEFARQASKGQSDTSKAPSVTEKGEKKNRKARDSQGDSQGCLDE
jgi:hypothetical protein